jgi:hypothetical protein
MAVEVKAPGDYSAYKGRPSVFLAGSIEMGKAEHWQRRVAEALKDRDLLILNPRRDNWDDSWEQNMSRPEFRVQVEWELAALEYAGTVLVYFCPGTQSPITLLELGLHAATNPKKLIVCCPDGFWRKGNVDIICARYGVRQVDSLNALIAAIK